MGLPPPSAEDPMPYAAVNGLEMYHEVHGEGPPLLLLHGGSGSIIEPWILPFSSSYQVIAVEQMGHGRTADDPSRPFHYHDMAEDTLGLMDHLGVQRAVVVGHSDGGIIGLDLAIHHPERVDRLVATGANARTDGYTAENLGWIHDFDPAELPVSAAYARLSPDGPEHWPIFVARLKRMWSEEPDLTDAELATIKAPTLLIVGDADIVTVEHTVDMFRTIPNARLCVVPQAGHGAMPFETVLAFLRTTDPVSSITGAAGLDQPTA